MALELGDSPRGSLLGGSEVAGAVRVTSSVVCQRSAQVYDSANLLVEPEGSTEPLLGCLKVVGDPRVMSFCLEWGDSYVDVVVDSELFMEELVLV